MEFSAGLVRHFGRILMHLVFHSWILKVLCSWNKLHLFVKTFWIKINVLCNSEMTWTEFVDILRLFLIGLSQIYMKVSAGLVRHFGSIVIHFESDSAIFWDILMHWRCLQRHLENWDPSFTRAAVLRETCFIELSGIKLRGAVRLRKMIFFNF